MSCRNLSISNTISIILVDICYLFMIVMNILHSTGAFGASIGTVSDRYQLLITPASYAFSIWGVIFTLTGIYVLNLNINYFVKNNTYSHMKWINVVFCLNTILNGLWGVFWINEMLLAACIILSLIALTGSVLYGLLRSNELGRNMHPFLRLLNGVITIAWISIYWPWTCGATLLNLGSYLKYESPLSGHFDGDGEVNGQDLVLSVALTIGLVSLCATVTAFTRSVMFPVTVSYTLLAVIVAIDDRIHSYRDRECEYKHLVLKVVSVALAIVGLDIAAGLIATLLHTCKKRPIMPQTSHHNNHLPESIHL